MPDVRLFPPQFDEDLRADISDLRNTVFSSTYLLLEIISTLEDEVRLIWPSRWSIMKIIFLLNRYSPLIDSTLGLTMMLGTTDPHVSVPFSRICAEFDVCVSDLQSCDVQFHFLIYTYTIGSFLSESILIARTLALYEFNPWIMCIMATIALGVIVPGLYMSHYVLSRIQYPSRAVLEISGCVPSIDDGLSWVLYMCVLISETVVIALTVYKMWQTSVDLKQRSLLVWTMYRDGSLYYVVLLVLSIVNLCFMLLAPKAATSIIQMPLRVVHSTLCTRVLLNLRKVAARLADMTLTLESRSAAHPRSRLAFALDGRGGGGGGYGDGDGYAPFGSYVDVNMDCDLNGEMDLGIDIDIELDSVDVDADGRDPEASIGPPGDGG
ncbi:hypothetical protein ONZ51_g12233 [Trametes cubensis]|uniref:DUF6533 domain-containing protein n=1 Tax=Trametes cubensis TaxID=1111947 RepID=A0AAD7TG25_9APHY|nr:hypothetical protein ONZ51_g12233 [Trametes cubensis]